MNIILMFLELTIFNIFLSADNSLLISAATKNLNKKDKKIATTIGVALALVLRFIFIIILFFIAELSVPIISILGGIVIIKLALDLTKKKKEIKNKDKGERDSKIISAITKILLVDFAMSFDNSLILFSISENFQEVEPIFKIVFISIALLISFPVIIFGSKIISNIFEKYNFFNYIAMFLLIYLGIDLIMKDAIFGEILETKHEILDKFLLLFTSLIFTTTKYIYDKNII